MSDNMALYNAVRTPPPEAIREIKAGRLSGKSDINPMWRIKALTEQFGPCGEGWKYTIERLWTEQGANGEIAAFALINLYYRVEGQWSDPIPGIGGNSFVAKEKNGMYTSDECYKMALTDAISVACKALGVAADVYWQSDKTKYTKATEPDSSREKADDKLIDEFYRLGDEKGRDKGTMSAWAHQSMGGTPENLTKSQLNRLMKAVERW